LSTPCNEPIAEYVAEDGFGTDAPEDAIWSCKIGWANRSDLPEGADGPLRQAVEIAFYNLTGKDPEFTFSGWGAELTDAERGALTDGTGATDGC
jgi:hypothetical protein